MRTVATLQAPTAGSIKFGDIDVLADPERAAEDARLPSPGLRRLSARLGLRDARPARGAEGHHRQRRAPVRRRDACSSRPTSGPSATARSPGFSGGMRQRFGIAQALIGAPELIIVDEPTAGLDPEERNRFLNLLAGIGDNVVVILSTHIVDDVADLCPLMAVLANGKVQLAGQARRSDRRHPRQDLEEGDQPNRVRRLPVAIRSHLQPPVRRQFGDPRPGRQAARRLRTGRRRPGGCLFLDALHAPPRGLRETGHASRDHRLRDPVPAPQPGLLGRCRHLLPDGFGIAASENVSIGTPGAVHENAPYAIAVATAVFSLFYLFVVTAFVANAIVRDDSTGFSPIIRADVGHRSADRDWAVHRRADRRVDRLSRSAARHSERSGDAVGRPRDGGAAKHLLLRLEFRGLRDPQHLPDLRHPVRASRPSCDR